MTNSDKARIEHASDLIWTEFKRSIHSGNVNLCGVAFYPTISLEVSHEDEIEKIVITYYDPVRILIDDGKTVHRVSTGEEFIKKLTELRFTELMAKKLPYLY